jgi:hypothetical protein
MERLMIHMKQLKSSSSVPLEIGRIRFEKTDRRYRWND